MRLGRGQASAPAPAASGSQAAAGPRVPAPRPRGQRERPGAIRLGRAGTLPVWERFRLRRPPAAAAADNTDCDIIVPANPLSAQGLATPYQLTGPNGTSPADSGCNMANAAALGAFVQATILNPRTGALSVYNPLVITQGTTPAVAPVVPKLPRDAIVTIDFGFNGDEPDPGRRDAQRAAPGPLRQRPRIALRPAVVLQRHRLLPRGVHADGLRAAARAVPGDLGQDRADRGPLGTGRACPNVRNFDMIDQDQSDNVTSVYLLNPATGQTAQDTAANEAGMTGTQALVNGSDNALVDKFMDPVLGCTPFMAPDLANNNTPATSQALDELLPPRRGTQPRVPALVPENDPMVLDANGNLDPAKTNLYRAEVGQPAISRQNDRWDSPANYCQNMINIQGPFLAANQAVFAAGPSPVPDVGNNLFTFLANRLLQSFDNLGCKNFGLTNPIQVVTDGNGAATSATINTTPQQATGTGANAGGGQGNGGQGKGQQSWQQIWRQFLGRGGQDNQQDGGM